MKSFWSSLSKPFFVQAPMEGVTDTVLRQVLLKTGRPDVFFTEFVNVDGFCSPKGKEDVSKRLRHSPREKLLVVQIWGASPTNFYETSRALKEMNFAGIDINMGCPEREVVKSGSGAALINNPTLVKEIICATRDGAGKLPVSVKTRIGFKSIQTDEWIGFLLSQKLDAISIHVRTAKDAFAGEAHWEEMKKIIALRNKISPQTIIVGNGSVLSVRQGRELAKTYRCEGIMIGRGILHNLWVFSGRLLEEIPMTEKINSLICQLELFEKTWSGKKDFNSLKKFYRGYISGISDGARLRSRLYSMKTLRDTISFLRESLFS